MDRWAGVVQVEATAQVGIMEAGQGLLRSGDHESSGLVGEGRGRWAAVS